MDTLSSLGPVVLPLARAEDGDLIAVRTHCPPRLMVEEIRWPTPPAGGDELELGEVLVRVSWESFHPVLGHTVGRTSLTPYAEVVLLASELAERRARYGVPAPDELT